MWLLHSSALRRGLSLVPMPSFEKVALELLEYKLNDLTAGRSTPGGPAATWALHDRLTRSAGLLDEADRRQLTALGQRLRTVGETPRSLKDAAHSLDDLVLGADTSALDDQQPVLTEERPAERLLRHEATASGTRTPTPVSQRPDPRVMAEQAELRKLATAVWWNDLDRFMTQVAATLRAERDRYTARLLYATHRNLLRYGAAGEYHDDANLSRFRVEEAIPARDDALVSVDDLDSLVELVREILSTIMELGEPGTVLEGLELPRDHALDYVQRVALAVAADPYAGSHALIRRRDPGSRELRLAIQELGREWLPEEERISQRRELEQRLQAVLAFERHQKQSFDRDVQQFSALMRAFFEKAARFLPRSVGGQASGPQLQGGVLGGVNPLLALETVPEGATGTTVHLDRDRRFRLASMELGVREQSGVRSLSADGRETPLERDFILETGRGKLHGFTEGDYLHLRFEDFGRSLAVLVAEALAAHYVLANESQAELLLTLKILANTVVGEPQELIRQAIARLATLSANVPRRRTAIEGFLRGSAKAAGVELSDSVIHGLVHRLHTALSVGPSDLSALLDRLGNAEANVYPLTGDPLSVTVGNTNLTVRQYRGRGEGAQESMVVMLPGRTLGSFTDYLIEPLGAGTIICVKGDQDLAVIYLRDGQARNPTLPGFQTQS